MRRLLGKLEAALTAAAFAEDGEVETAKRIVSQARGLGSDVESHRS